MPRYPAPSALAIATALAALACHPTLSPSPVASPPLAPGAVSTTAPLTSRQRHWVDSTLASLDLHDRVGQMVMIWMLGDYTNAHDSSYAEAIRWVEQDHVGGIAMSLGTPVEVAAKLNDIQRRARVPLIVGADLEPGLGRLEGGIFSNYMLDAGSATVFPPQMAIGATGRDSDAYEVAKAIAQEGRAVGIEVNFAPVVDVNNNPANPVINVRSFGEDPAHVAVLAANAVRGTLAGGELPTTKHFPGHGNTDVDSHVGLPIVTGNMAELDTVELVPFRAAINAGAALVMTAHIALPAVEGDSTTPATLAPKIITGLLRDTLHFTGTAITDAMTMGGIGKGYTTEESSVLAVQAGADILLKPDDPTRAIDAVVAGVQDGRISRARIDLAVRHILELKVRSGVAFGSQVSLASLREIVGSPEHRALAQDVARRAITLLREGDNAIPLADTSRTLVVEYAPYTELKAGRTFNRVLQQRARRDMTVTTRIAPNSNQQALDSVMHLADNASTVIVTAYVRRVEGQGRFAIPQPIAAWIDTLAQRHRTIVVAFGNPYLIGQFPSVRTYIDAYGVSDALEQAAADAILGRQAITGHAPVSLPGFFKLGDGVQRSATTAPDRRR